MAPFSCKLVALMMDFEFGPLFLFWGSESNWVEGMTMGVEFLGWVPPGSDGLRRDWEACRESEISTCLPSLCSTTL